MSQRKGVLQGFTRPVFKTNLSVASSSALHHLIAVEICTFHLLSSSFLPSFLCQLTMHQGKYRGIWYPYIPLFVVKPTYQLPNYFKILHLSCVSPFCSKPYRLPWPPAVKTLSQMAFPPLSPAFGWSSGGLDKGRGGCGDGREVSSPAPLRPQVQSKLSATYSLLKAWITLANCATEFANQQPHDQICSINTFCLRCIA